MILVNERGDVVRLGARVTTGGEGAIYEVASEAPLLAKLYHEPSPQQAAKLQHMCRAGNTALFSIAAWPRSPLFASNDRLRQTVRGFLMPRIEGKEIHRLYGPRDRQLEFPAAAWDFLICVARNCAAAFETLHENDVVMADVNEKNLLITGNGQVRLIDCDSYQVRMDGRHFLCDVGVPLWTPPELQARVREHGYRGLERSANHDRFGLAILIFELLFMGRHPFAGVPDGHHELELHEAIRRYLFAFSPKAWPRGIRAPPHTLPLAALPQRLAGLFDRAFLPGSERPDTRPTGREWAHALDTLHTALKTSSYDPGHKYWNGLASCPWCEIAAGGGPDFFISVAIHLGAAGAVADASAFWATIQRIVGGDLMRKSVGPVKLPAVAARPMPLARPSAPRLSKPQAPSPPIPSQLPSLPPPLLPPPPQRSRLARIRRLPLGRHEREARASRLGTLACGLAGVECIALGLPGAYVAGAGALAFLLLRGITFNNAFEERRRRREVEDRAREEVLREAEAEFARRMAEHDAAVNQLRGAHARAVAEAEAAHAREHSRREAEHRSKLSAYSAELGLFESAWVRFEEEKLRWENESSSRTRAVEQSRREMNDAWERLRGTLAGYQAKVNGYSVRLESAHQRYQKASAGEAADMEALRARRREAQLRQFLDSNLIRNHPIHGIGPVKAATLVAYGFESALDITRTMTVPGIGPVLLGNLLSWRAQCESAFRYNPNTPLPQADVQAVKMKYAQVKQSSMVELREGAATLSVLETETRRAVSGLESKLPQLARAYAQALADQKECS